MIITEGKNVKLRLTKYVFCDIVQRMQDILKDLGLRDKEAKCYVVLLENGRTTAAMLAKQIGETRTNTYMILENLDKVGLVETDESQAVRRYRATEPANLKRLLMNRQHELKQANTTLNQALPKLQSLYNLGQLKPGVVYLEGLDGLRAALDDMARSKETARIIPSGDSPHIPEAWDILQSGVNKRAKLGVKSKIIFPESLRTSLEFERLKKQGMTIRFWGEREYPGEFVVYGDKCLFTTYKPRVINTILTDAVIAQTLRMLFDDIWEKAKP